jgi:glycosyltransferase involved in cell wall biosynthesis
LAQTEDHVAYANIIQELYDNPEKFDSCNRACWQKVFHACGAKQTIAKEIALLQETAKLRQRTKPEAADNPVLTVVVPAYNTASLLNNCIFTLINHQRASLLEILIINDGSTDNTQQVAEKLCASYNDPCLPIIRVINKQNGGHGSAINLGLHEARGRYFRVVDSDDWVDSEAFAELLGILDRETSSIVLTDYSEERTDKTALIPKQLYMSLAANVKYFFEDLCYPGYGFGEWGPILATGNYRTDMLREAGLELTEKSSYVDMEFNLFAVLKADTVVYYPLDIYRYYIGSQSQSISKSSYLSRRTQHENIIFSLLEHIEARPEIGPLKQDYLIEKLVVPMIQSQYLIVRDWLKSPKEIAAFSQRLNQWLQMTSHPRIAKRLRALERDERRRKSSLRRALDLARKAKRRLLR